MYKILFWNNEQSRVDSATQVKLKPSETQNAKCLHPAPPLFVLLSIKYDNVIRRLSNDRDLFVYHYLHERIFKRKNKSSYGSWNECTLKFCKWVKIDVPMMLFHCKAIFKFSGEKYKS